MGVVAYAFRATRTPTSKTDPATNAASRSSTGSKEDYAEDNSHPLWQDQLGLFTTLLIGIDPNERFFVAADPALHNPTKFFIRLEFKDEHAARVRREGWHSWERERRGARGEGPTELLVGGVLERFVDLVRFERAALGLDPGNRQLLAEKTYLFRRHADERKPEPLKATQLHPLVSGSALASAKFSE